MTSTKQKKLQDFLTFLAQQPKGFIYQENTPQQTIKNKYESLRAIQEKCKNCKECPLAYQGRTQVVFGVGSHDAKLMFVGEAPGRDEDIQGKPFVGRAGKLLTKIIEAMKLTREEVFISNVVKCRPPNNRTPTIEERETCKNLILFKEIEVIQPKIICTLGSPSTKALLGDNLSISRVRGQFFSFKNYLVMPTFHPAYLLRNPSAKKLVWEDMKKIITKLKELN